MVHGLKDEQRTHYSLKRGLEPFCGFYFSSRTLPLVKPLTKKQHLRDSKFSVITMGTTNDFIRVEKL